MQVVDKHRDAIRLVHDGSPYYEQAEQWLASFWVDRAAPFRPAFDQLDLRNTVELACGHGRHAAQIVDHVGRITLVDIVAANIDACRERFSGKANVSYCVNNGKDLSALPSDAYTSLYSYDAMVHFEALDVISYVFEAARILRHRGRALLHYSVNEATPEAAFSEGTHWRNYFSENLMRHVASRARLSILQSVTFPWPYGTPGRPLDGLVLMEKTD